MNDKHDWRDGRWGFAHDGAPESPVVLTCVDVDGRSVLAVPAPLAWAEATTYFRLLAARTFGEARADPAAAALVDSWLEGFLEDRRDAADEHVTGADSDPFDAEEFFGADNWQVWRPDARKSTANFLEQDHPDLAARYLRADTVQRLLVDDDEPVIAPADRASLEADLRSHGRRVQPWPDLAELYLGPNAEQLAALRDLL